MKKRTKIENLYIKFDKCRTLRIKYTQLASDNYKLFAKSIADLCFNEHILNNTTCDLIDQVLYVKDFSSFLERISKHISKKYLYKEFPISFSHMDYYLYFDCHSFHIEFYNNISLCNFIKDNNIKFDKLSFDYDIDDLRKEIAGIEQLKLLLKDHLNES